MIEVVTFTSSGRRIDVGEPDGPDAVEATIRQLLADGRSPMTPHPTASVYVDGKLVRAAIRERDLTVQTEGS